MINRRQLRVKALQGLYGHFVQQQTELEASMIKLNKRIDRLYDLYIYQLSFLLAISDFAEQRLQVAQKKFIPTEKELNPNSRFIDNRLIALLKTDVILQKNIDRLKIKWSTEEEELIRKVYISFSSSDTYQKYMDASTDSLDQDIAIVVDLIRDHLAVNDVLHHFYEENNMFWNDDFYDALLMAQRCIKDYSSSNSILVYPSVFKSVEQGGKEDIEFYQTLFRKAVQNSKEFDEMIDKKASNWEFERIAFMDILLIKMALTEFLFFKHIPIKVSMNEYIELSKYFSTPKSRSFINGVLDKLVTELNKEGRINKIGRGLKE